MAATEPKQTKRSFLFGVVKQKELCFFYLHKPKQKNWFVYLEQKTKRLYFVFIVDIGYGADKWCL